MEVQIIAITIGLISIVLAGTAIYLSLKHEKRTKHYANQAQQHLNQTRETVSKIDRQVDSISYIVRRQIDRVLRDYRMIIEKLVSTDKKRKRRKPKSQEK